MKLSEYIKAVKTLCAEIHTEDMDDSEKRALNKRIVLAANMGVRDIERSTYPLLKSQTVTGPAVWPAPDEYIRLQECSGGRFERYVGEKGREELHLQDKAEYRITYHRYHEKMEADEDTFEFPDDVMNALIYYGVYHVLSGDNDKRNFVYFKNLYDQECVNIVANRPGRLTVVREKRGGMRAL